MTIPTNPWQQIRQWQRLIQIEPDDAELRYNLGVAWLAVGETSAALKAFQESVRLDPKKAQAWFNLAICYQRMGYPDSAINTYERALAVDPADDQAWHNLAMLWLDREEYAKAEYCLQKTLATGFEKPETWNQLSICQYQTRNLEAAEASIRQAIELNGSEARAWEQLGLVLSAQQRFVEAIEAYTKALELDPCAGRIWNNQGVVFMTLGRLAEAEHAFRTAIEHDVAVSDAWFNLGELLHQIGSFREAADCFQQRLKDRADDLEAWEYLAECQMTFSAPEACNSLLEVLSIGGDRSQPLCRLAKLYAERNDLESELSIRLRLHQIDPHRADNLKRLADLYLEQGKPEFGYRFLCQGRTSTETDPNIWYRLAQYFQSKERHEEELDCLEQLLAKEPNHLPAWIRLGSLSQKSGLPEKASAFLRNGAGDRLNDFPFWSGIVEWLLEQKRLQDALACCEPVLAVAVVSPKAWKTLGRQFEVREQRDQMAIWLEKQLISRDWPSPLILALGAWLEEKGYFPLVERIYAHHQPRFLTQIAFVRRNIRIQISCGRLDRVQTILQGVPEYLLNDVEGLILQGDLKWQAGDNTEAEVFYTR